MVFSFRWMGMACLMIGLTAGAAPSVPYPLLGRVIGEVGENGEVERGPQKRCFIYTNQVILQDYDPLTGQVSQSSRPITLTGPYVQNLLKGLAAASAQKEEARLHIIEQRPNVYYFGYHGPERVRLFFTGPRTLVRKGNEARDLLSVVEYLCPHR